MQYYKILEDKDLFEYIGITTLSKVLGVHESYLYRVKIGAQPVSEEQYLRIKNAILSHLSENKNKTLDK